MSECNNFEFTSPDNNWDMLGGIRAADGVTFYPHVSAAGILSWTNDGGKQNPDPVDIKGEDGMSAFFVAEYEETTYDEIQTAISEGKYVCAGRSGFPESYIYYPLAGGAQGSDVWGDYNALVFARFDIDALNNKKLYKLTCKKYTLSGSTQWESETLPVELADDVLAPIEQDISDLKSVVGTYENIFDGAYAARSGNVTEVTVSGTTYSLVTNGGSIGRAVFYSATPIADTCFEPGKTYTIEFTSSDSDLLIDLYYKTASSGNIMILSDSPGHYYVDIPADATTILFRITVPAGKSGTITATVKVFAGERSYTPLIEEVADLKSAVNDLNSYDIERFDWSKLSAGDGDYGWHGGYWNVDTGAQSNSSTFMRTNAGYTVDLTDARKIKVTPPSGYAVSVVAYKKDGTLVSFGHHNSQTYPENIDKVIYESLEDFDYCRLSVGKFTGAAGDNGTSHSSDEEFVNSVLLDLYYEKKSLVGVFASDGDAW